MLQAEFKAEISGLKAEVMTEIGDLRKSSNAWMLTILVAIIGAMASIQLLA